MTSKKHINITGTSNISWKDAIIKTISDASDSICNLSTLTILKQWAKIQDDKISEYYVDLDIEFEIDKNLQCSYKNIQADNLDE